MGGAVSDYVATCPEVTVAVGWRDIVQSHAETPHLIDMSREELSVEARMGVPPVASHAMYNIS
jgi:hypothetical protein